MQSLSVKAVKTDRYSWMILYITMHFLTYFVFIRYFHYVELKKRENIKLPNTESSLVLAIQLMECDGLYNPASV